MGRINKVRKYFENPGRYLGRRGYDIKLRAETVQAFTEGKQYKTILDIGCGDGSISIPLLSEKNDLTLVDISQSMLERARHKVPPALMPNAHFVNGDIMNTALNIHGYDLIICLGVTAHVESPRSFLARIVSLMAPTGTLIFEFTDSFHFMARLTHVYELFCSLIRPATYPLTRVSSRRMLGLFEDAGLGLERRFRYTPPTFGPHKLLSQPSLYRLVRLAFGNAERNRNAWMGDEWLVLLTR